MPGHGRPRVALVLSGGGARAAVHVGALEVLIEVVQPTCVVGVSAGALIGSIATLGHSPQEMIDMVRHDLSWPLLALVPGGNSPT
jgi:NTE family protein